MLSRALWLPVLAGSLSGCVLVELAEIRQSFPPLQGTFTVSELSAEVEITRDDLAVPHIRASTPADAWRGLGFVHGQDRYYSADLLRRLAFGRVSEWLGDGAADLDAFMRAMDLQNRADSLVAAQKPEVVEMLEAYAEGMNAGIATLDADPIEYRLIGVSPEPWEARDAYGVLMMQAWNLTVNPDHELAAWNMRDEADAQMIDQLFRFNGQGRPLDDYWASMREVDVGEFTSEFLAFSGTLGGRPESAEASNNWVVGGARSADGLPILANDPHLGQQVPSLWYVADLKGGDLHVAGATLPGAPGVPVGHNDTVAWGLTNVQADVADFAVFELDGDGYVLNGQTVAFDTRDVEISIGDGETVTRTVRATAVGPVVTTGATHVMALQWTGLSAPDQMFEYLLNFAEAEDVPSLLPLMELPALVSQNVALADVDGNFGYQSMGVLPVRRGFTGRVPYPASSGELGWDGWNSVLPGELNPERGYSVTANSRPIVESNARGSVEGIDRDAISSAFTPPVRFDRINELLEASDGATPERMLEVQLDVEDGFAAANLPNWLEGVSPTDPQAQACRQMLEGWNYHMDVDSAAAAVYAIFVPHLMREALGRQLSDNAVQVYLESTSTARTAIHADFDRFLGEDRVEIVSAALGATCAELTDTLGRRMDRWTWGDMHPLALKHPVANGQSLLNRWHMPEVPWGGSGNTVAAAHYSMVGEGVRPVAGMVSLRLVVPMSDVGAATLVHPGGQSGHPRHPDADSHFEAFTTDQTTPLWYEDDDVAANARDRILLTP